MIRIIFLFSLLLLTTGCPGGPSSFISLGSYGTRYTTSELKGNERGNILILPARKVFENDLVFKSYLTLSSKYLNSNGLTVVKDENNLKYVAFLNYGFREIKSTPAPVTYKVANKSITITADEYAINSPTGHVITNGFGAPRGRNFERVIEISIFDLTTEKPQQLIATKVISVGGCGVISQLSDVLVPMLFENWPPKTGEAEKIYVTDFKVNGC